MKKITSLLALFIISSSCAVKQTHELLTSGEYDAAIRNAVDGLRANKNAKGKQDYVYILEEAFAKAKERDLRDINDWFKDANPQNLEKIYNTYVQLNYRQETIKPLLPLHFLKENKDAIFPFDDYSNALVKSKEAYCKYLYDNSKALIATKDKKSCRRAYEDLTALETLISGYKDSAKLKEEALAKGIDYVLVTTKNNTDVIIPKRLQDELLNFDTYNLNDKWTTYHSLAQKGLVYDFDLLIDFKNIAISPEEVKENLFEKVKSVKDGFQNNVLTGNTMKDGQGNPVKVDNMVEVRIKIDEFTQSKTCQVTARLDFTDLDNGQIAKTTTISGSVDFKNVYATFKGDKRACDPKYLPTFDKKALPFPTNEQMVYDAGNDLKAKLKDIIAKNKFR
jgi:hypothetical protein